MHSTQALSVLLVGLFQSAAPDSSAELSGAQSATPAPSRIEEHFVIEQLDPALDLDPWQLLGADMNSTELLSGAQPPSAVGILTWRRSESITGLTLEMDLRFPDRETRLLHLERVRSTDTSLVYREMRPQSGRTLCADWFEGGDVLQLREWDGHEGLRENLGDASGAVFPLECIEALRDEDCRIERARVFDPLSRQLEELQVRIQWAEADGAWAGTRRVELVRADGSLAGAYLLRGSEILGFQWQAGNLRVRRIDAAEHATRLGAYLEAPQQDSTEE